MNFDQFNTLRDQALMLHASQTGDHVVGLDAVFTAVALHAYSDRARPRPMPAADAPPAPQWFADAVRSLKGQRVTASAFLLLAGRTPATDVERRHVGRWLRSAGVQPRKIAGELLFQL